MPKFNHLDLFSGIGGFALAAQWVWGKDHNIYSFIEIDPFCQKVLKKHWPEVPIISDIKEYKHDGTTIDLLTGGFPCQPFSVAGKQRGKEDNRYLWPEMLRIISEVHPTWIIGENVSGIINMGLDQVLSDLENEGYACQPFIIPACAVNAPHRRDRVWIVGYSEHSGFDGSKNGQGGFKGSNGNTQGQNKFCKPTRPDLSGETIAYAKGSKCEQPGRTWTRREGFTNNNSFAPDTSNQRLQRNKRPGTHEKKETALRPITECNNAWDEPWLEVATRLCRVDDGIPRKLDRINRLKSLGNAIVPQVVVPIMQAIREINSKTTHNP